MSRRLAPVSLASRGTPLASVTTWCLLTRFHLQRPESGQRTVSAPCGDHDSPCPAGVDGTKTGGPSQHAALGVTGPRQQARRVDPACPAGVAINLQCHGYTIWLRTAYDTMFDEQKRDMINRLTEK